MSDLRTEAVPETSRRKKWLYATFLLVIPSLLYTVAVVVPFLPLATSAKVWAAGGFVLAAEIVFWGTAIIIGKEVAKRYRRFFDPRNWFRGERR